MKTEGVDYFIYLIDMPATTCACSTKNDDGTYSLFLNSSLPFEKQKEAAEHEVIHIESGHLDLRDENVDGIEYSTHSI